MQSTPRTQPLRRRTPGHPRAPGVRLSALALLTHASISHAQPDEPAVTVDANVPPARLWTHHLTFPESIDGPRFIAFAPDRDSIYVQHAVTVLDAWSLLVSYWPEILAGALAIATLLILLIHRRLHHRPQTPGTPHCRRCNYDLSPQISRDARARLEVPDATRCPECGILIARKRPVRGRRTITRLAPALTIYVLFALTYAAALASGVPRQGRVSLWFDWSSTSLAKRATDNNLASLVTTGTRLVRVDLPSGTVDRILSTRRDPLLGPITVTPDGAGVIVHGNPARRQLLMLSTRTGRRLSMIEFPDPRQTSHFTTLDLAIRQHVLGFLEDPHVTLVQDRREILAWDRRTGLCRLLIKLDQDWPAFVSPLRPRQLFTFSNHRAGVTVWPLPVESNAATITTPARTIHSDFSFSRSATLSPDIRRFYYVDGSGTYVRELDIEHQRVVRSVSPGRSFTLRGELSIDPIGTLLAASCGIRSIIVRDLAGSAWVANLTMPDSCYSSQPMFFGPGNRWFAALAQSGDGRTTPFRLNLLLWNLEQIIHAPPPPADPPVRETDAP